MLDSQIRGASGDAARDHGGAGAGRAAGLQRHRLLQGRRRRHRASRRRPASPPPIRSCCRSARSIEIDSIEPRYNGIYTIMDTGPRVQGRQVDIYMWSCNEALQFGRRPVRLVVLRLGWNPRATTPGFIDRCSSAAEPAAAARRARCRLRASPQRTPRVQSERRSLPQLFSFHVLFRRFGLVLQLEQLEVDAALRRAAPGACPASRSRPLCSTRILSMSWIVDRRCAMAIVVRPAISACSASRISSSVSVSTLDVASSRISTRGSNASARANESSCFCPTDSVAPRSATGARVAVRQALDERVRVHGAGRPPQPLVVDGRVAQPDVVGNRAGEQMHVLQHEAEQPAQVGEVEIADVDAVDGDPPARSRRRTAAAG